jgi:hypothetical protein
MEGREVRGRGERRGWKGDLGVDGFLKRPTVSQWDIQLID